MGETPWCPVHSSLNSTQSLGSTLPWFTPYKIVLHVRVFSTSDPFDTRLGPSHSRRTGEKGGR